MILLYILLATTLISALSLLGVFIISKNSQVLNKIVFLLVGLSTGTLLGGAFFHLIPESAESMDIEQVLLLTLISFCAFFLIEKLLHWHHCHEGNCDEHSIGHINLIGDAIHNFIDGLIIATAFSVSVNLGIVTSLALAFHEIPQEISDLGVLIYSGIERKKAIFYNFLVALTSMLGGVLGYFFLSSAENWLSYLLPLAAGGFLYISTSDLIPEIKKEPDLGRSLKAYGLFIVGLVLMYAFKFVGA